MLETEARELQLLHRKEKTEEAITDWRETKSLNKRENSICVAQTDRSKKRKEKYLQIEK
jgi:hypothetical protein